MVIDVNFQTLGNRWAVRLNRQAEFEVLDGVSTVSSLMLGDVSAVPALSFLSLAQFPQQFQILAVLLVVLRARQIGLTERETHFYFLVEDQNEK